MEIKRHRRRALSKVYPMPNGSMTVTFPKFISELKAVSDFYKLESVPELISRLQAVCLAEGLRPEYRNWEPEDTRAERILKEQRERASRLADARARKKAERERLGADFPDRVKNLRNKLGDF